jgi:hypothetical protein
VSPRHDSTHHAAAEARRRLFLHQDGLALGVALTILDDAEVLIDLSDDRAVPLADVIEGRSQTSGTIAASIRAGESAGWVEVDSDRADRMVSLTPSGAANRALFRMLIDVTTATAAHHSEIAGPDPVDLVEDLARAVTAAKHTIDDGTDRGDLAHRYLEGVVATSVVPAVVAQGGSSDTAASVMQLLDADARSHLGDELTRYTPMYGLLGSYSEVLLRSLHTHTPLMPPAVRAGTNRAQNVSASGAAHRSYFDAAEEAIVNAVGQAEGTVAIVDVGCGDGTWLASIHDAFARRGLGADIVLVGADYDHRALVVAAETLADRPAFLTHGDVGDPMALATSVENNTGIGAERTLYIRSFVDHNRPLGATGDHSLPAPDAGHSIAVTDDGGVLYGNAVQQDWRVHLRDWAEVIGPLGLVIIEAHTLPPHEVAALTGQVHLLSFELYHTVSGQSPISIGELARAFTAAGMTSQMTTAPAWKPLISTTHARPA